MYLITEIEEKHVYNICDDWGWYVDIENNNKIINLHSYKDKFNQRTFLQPIYETYDDDDDDEHLMTNISNFYKIGSTTIATFVLTYIYIVWVFI